MQILFTNNLPPNPPVDVTEHARMDKPHDFNTSNLHTHGLHVSPSGNSDNVLLSIEPGHSLDYVIQLPANHPAGTFWYHSHRHGSTAIQVASGMAGALIIPGKRPLQDKAQNGGVADIDTILYNSDGTPFPERWMVLNQTPYVCVDSTNSVADKICGLPGTNLWKCPPGCIGVLESYDNFGPRSWNQFQRYTTINGEVMPVLRMKTGEIERWRCIEAAQRETIALKLIPLPRPNASRPGINVLAANPDNENAAEEAAEKFRSQPQKQQQEQTEALAKSDEAVSLWEFAVDGLTRNEFVELKSDYLQLGYRSDVLAFVPKPGIYVLLDETLPKSANVSRSIKDRRILAFVSVRGPAITEEPRAYLINKLIEGAQTVPEPYRAILDAQLRRLDISAFAPLPSFTTNELSGAGVQSAVFNIDVSGPQVMYQVNGREYNPQRVDHTMRVGTVDTWVVSASAISGHPYHIHVNPFQISGILTPNGKDAFTTTNLTENPLYEQYKNLKGVWRDTLFVGPNYVAQFRTRYETYVGEFVLHCHILDHEDQGMMQNVSIVP